MFENFVKTYPKPKGGPAFKYTTMVRHNGTVIAFAMNDQQRIFYSVLDLGDQRTKGPIDVNYWQDNPQELGFPNEVETVGEGLFDPRMMPVYKLGSDSPESPDSRVKENEKDHFRSTTAFLSADAPIQVLSDNKFIYVFRQSRENSAVGVAADTLLVDRFVLSGTTLAPKREVRYQRSRNKYRPQSRKDGLGAKDMEKKPFFEPTQKLEFVHHLKGGWFSVLIVPTQIANVQRWQIFAYNDATKVIDSFNIERSADGLFNLRGSNLFVRPDSDTVPVIGNGEDPGRTLVREGYAEWALRFDGTTTIKLAEPLILPLTNSLTLEFWLRPESFDSPQSLVADVSQTPAGIISIDTDGRLQFDYGEAEQFGSTQSLVAGEWCHAALVIDGDEGQLRWYLNGEEAGALAQAITGPVIPGVGLAFGNGDPGPFTGLVDEVRIWARTRSSGEIVDTMQHRLIGYEPGLALYWRFDEGSGSRIHDQTDSANHAEVSGTVDWRPSDAPVGDHPGVRRSSFSFDGRDVVTGMSALLYYHQEKNKSGYDGKDKPLKTKARVMLATATYPVADGDENKNHISVLDFGLSRDGKLGQIPDNIILKNVEASGDRALTSREIQQQIVFWEQKEDTLQTSTEQFQGNIDVPSYDPSLNAADYRLPDTDNDGEVILVKGSVRLHLKEGTMVFEESDDDSSPEVLALASWKLPDGKVVGFSKTTDGANASDEEDIPETNGQQEDQSDDAEEPNDQNDDEAEIPPELLVGTTEWLEAWTGWEPVGGSGEAALVVGDHFFYFKGNRYKLFDWSKREFSGPQLIADNTFPGLWDDGVDAAHTTADGSVVFYKGLLFKKYTQKDGAFVSEDEGNINKLYPGVPFLFLHPEYRSTPLADIEKQLKTDLQETEQTLLQLRADLMQAQNRELQNLEIEIEMHLVHVDPFGLSTMGGLLTFAWAKGRPLLFDSANGKLALYFQGMDDQFFVAYYDTMTNAVNMEIPAESDTKIACIPRIVGPMAETVIKIDGEDTDVCDISLKNAALDIDEGWTSVPRDAGELAAVINGAVQSILVGDLAQNISGLVNHVNLSNVTLSDFDIGSALVLGSYRSLVKRIVPNVGLSFADGSTHVEFHEQLVGVAGTIEMWIKFNGDEDQAIFDASTEVDNGKYFLIQILEGRLRFALENDKDAGFFGRVRLGKLEPGDDWHHLAAVWQYGDDGFLRLCYDGEVVATAEDVQGQPVAFLTPFVGKSRGDYHATANFAGEIAEVCIHETALPADQIAERSARGVFGSSPDGARACVRFEAGTDDAIVAINSSENPGDVSVAGGTLVPVGPGTHRVDIEPVEVTQEIAQGTHAYSVVAHTVDGVLTASPGGQQSMLFAADASKAQGRVANVTVHGSAANSPLTRWVAYAQGSTLEFDGRVGSVVPRTPEMLSSFDAQGDLTLESWIRPEPMSNGRFSRVVHHYSDNSLYLLGFEPKSLKSAMYFNASDADKAYAWAEKQLWNPFLGARNWAYAAADAAIAASGAGKSTTEIATAAENAARDAITIQPFFWFFTFWAHYERDRVGDVANDWARRWAGTHQDYVEVENVPALNPGSDQWTVELWFKVDRVDGYNILYNKEHLFEAQIRNGYFEYAWQPGWVWVTEVFPVIRGRWYHVAIVYDGKEQRVYRNGVQVFSRDMTGSMGATNFPLLIGARYINTTSNPPTHFFKGAIDELRIWSEARSLPNILNNLNKRLRGDEENLRGYWHFEEGLARDFTPLKNDGLLHDSPHTVNSVMPGYAITAGIGNEIEGGFSETHIQTRDAIPFFDWNHIAASYNASYGLRFQDEAAIVDCGNSSSLDLTGDLTIEAFFRLDNLKQPRGLISKGNALPGYSLYINLQGRLVFTFVDEKGAEQSFLASADSSLQVGLFYRVAAVRRHQSQTRDVQRQRRINGETVTINVPEVEEWDDIEIHVCQWTGSGYSRRFGLAKKYGGPSAGQNSENFVIGRASGRTSTTFNGVIGEVRVWSRGLGQLETCQNITGVESGLVSWWRFDENQGYVAEDVTGTNPANINLADWVQNPDPLASSFRIFNNGVEMETIPVAAPTSAKGAKGFWVGPKSEDGKDAFKGTVEELRIWRASRTQEQIQDNMFLRLIGEKEDLIAYYTFDQTEEDELKDLSFRGNHLKVTDATFVVSDAPIGYDTFQVRNALLGVKTDFHDVLQGQPGVQEYGDMQFDSEGNLIGILKRCYSFIKDGQWFLVTGYKVGNLVTEWIGQVQFNPELKGFIEGAPPVPSENLTAGPVSPSVGDYTGVSSVEVIEAENVTYTYSTSKEAGLNASFGLSAQFGVDTTVLLITAPLGIGTATEISDVNVLVGLEGKFEAGAGWSSENTVGVGRNLTKSTKVTLGGNWEDPAHKLNTAMPRRYQPANMGFALVQSETADVFALRLEHNLALVSFQFRPNPDIPKDWNIIPFPINPRYTKQGTLDGGVGYDERGKVLDPDWPNAAEYGQHSYFKPKEAYSLKNRIVKEEQELINYFRSVDTSLGGAPDLAISAGLGLIDGATQGGAKGAIDGLVDALGSSGLPEKIGKQNIANTYVWTADGGFFAETTETSSMKQETTGGTFSFSGEVGAAVGVDFSVAGVDVSLGFSAMLGGSLNLSKTKTKESEQSFSLDIQVDVPGDLQAYDDDLNQVYDAQGNPLVVPGKVDAYRFMTFYLEPTNENFDTFFNTVVDPIWLAGNHPNALALKQAQQADKKPPCWRVMHRVTFVSRLLPEIPAASAPPIEKKMKVANVESNWQLIQKLDPFVRSKTGSFVEFSDAVRKAVQTQLPALLDNVDDVIEFLSAYYQVFEDV